MKPFIQRSISQGTNSLRVPSSVAVVFEIISGLQIIHLIIKTMTLYNDNNDKDFFLVGLVNYGLSYLGEISPIDLFSEPNSLLMFIWIFFAVYFVIHLIMLAWLFIFGCIRPKEDYPKLLKFMSWAYLVHSRLIFFVAHFFILGIINSYNNCSIEGSAAFYCKAAWFAPTILLCIFNVSIALIKELVLYQVLKNKDSYAVKNNLFHQITLLYKGIIVILFFLIQDDTSRGQVSAIMNIVFVILLLMTDYMKFPFYNVKVLKASIAITGGILSFSALALLQVLGVDKIVLDIVWAAVIPLFVKSSLIIFEIFSSRIIKGEFNSPEKALYFISVLKENKFGYIPNSLDDRNCSLGSIISSGILVSQNFDFEKLKGLDNWREYEERIYIHLVDKLTAILEKNSSSRVLLLTLANVCLKKLDNIPRTILLVKKLESLRLSIPVRTSLEGFNRKLDAYHTKMGDEETNKHLSLLSHFEYKEKAVALQKIMQFEVQKHIEFWDEMKKERVDVKKIIDISCDIDNSAFQVQRIFDSKFRGFTQHFLNPLMLYGAYQELVKEYSDDARKLLKQFWSLARGQARGQGLDVYCEELGVAIVSIEKNTMGSIIDTSGSMQTLFQVDKQKLLGEQLTFILPDFAANYLIRIIRNYAKAPSRKLEQTINTYGKQKDGNFFEVEVQLKLFPQVEREVKLMLMFRKIAQPKSILIVNTEGIILDASETLKQAFNLSLKSKSAPTRFQDFAPDFDLINAAFNQEFSNGDGTAIIRSFSSKLPSVRSSRFTNNFDGDQSFTRQHSMHHSVTIREPKKRNQSSKFAVKIADSKEFAPLETQSPGQSPKSINNQYKEICAEYSQGGRILIKNFMNIYSSHNPKSDLTFELQVAPCQLNGEVFKILTLTNTNNDGDKKSPVNGLLELAKSNIVFSAADTGDSGFADQFSEVDEKNPNLKTSLHYSAKGTTLTVDKFTKKVTMVSEDGIPASQAPEKKESAKMPDLEPFIQAHAPSKNRMSAKFAQSRSVSSTSSRTVASVKALKGAFGRDATFALSQRTTYLLFVLVVLMIALGILNYSMSTKASSQVKTGVSIVNVASLRLSMAMRGWQFAVRIYLRYNKLRTGDIPSLQASLLDAGKQILEYDRQFTGNVSKLIDKSLFSEIMDSNVNLWELNQTYTTTGDSTDTVTATSLLANKLMLTGLAPDYTANTNRELINYLCNNTANDYLVASNTLSAATQKMLQNTLRSNISNLQLVLGLEIAAVVVLCAMLVIVARIVIQLHQRLFRALVKIDERFLLERSHQLQKMKILLAEDLEIRGYGLSIFEDTKTGLSYHASEKAKDAKSKGAMKKVTFHQRADRISVLRLFIDLAKYVLVSLGVIQIITALFVVSLTRSLASFRNSQKITNQLSVTTQASSLSSIMVASTYYDMSFRNQTNMLISNMEPQVKLLQVMNQFLSVNNDIMSVFTEEGVGITDPFIQDLFQGTICSYLPTDDVTQTYCQGGTNYYQLGLLAMNSKLSENQNQYINQYLANPTYDSAFIIIDKYIPVIRPVAETLQVVYQVINAHIVGNFNDDNAKFTTQIALLHAGILVSILFATFVVLRVTIRRFRFLDTRRGNILKVLSYKMLLEDKAIGFYLNKHFVSSDTAFTRSL